MSAGTEGSVLTGEKLQEDQHYWLQRLHGGVPPSGLRLDYRRPQDLCPRTASVRLEISGEPYANLLKLTNSQPFLEYVALATALSVALHQYGQSSPVVFGCANLKTDPKEVDPENCVVAISEVDGEKTFRQLLLEVRQTLLAAHKHQSYPWKSLLKDLGVDEPANRAALFDVSLEFEGLHYPMPDVGQDLKLSFQSGAEAILGELAFSPQLYDEESIERFGQRILHVLRTGLVSTNTQISKFEGLTGQERRQLSRWNHNEAEYPKTRCMHQLFEEQVERNPGRTALVFGDQSLSYRDLSERANQLANHLQALGVGADMPVGISMNRSLELVIAILGVLKAGGAYIPLDPSYPKERLATMFEDVRLKVLLTQEQILERLPRHRTRVLCLDRDWETVAARSTEKPEERAGPTSLCYVIFTSGSTGRPKAAAVYHRGWTNLLHWFNSEFSVSPEDRTLVVSSISFDITQRAMAMPLISGGELHLVASNEFDPPLILDTVRERNITLLHCAPSTFYPLIEDAGTTDTDRSLSGLRVLFLGGEAISASRLKDWATSPHCRAEIANVYGAAECSDVSSFYRLHDFDRYAETSVPIGKPIHNTKIHLIDENLKEVPIGAPGEICLAGDGVGKGYINDEALTAKKYIFDPFSHKPGRKLYRTGDLGRLLNVGNLEFLGRLDHQVKIRGQRIELGEIETLLRKNPLVKEAMVVDRPDSSGERSLVAYFVPRESAAADSGTGMTEALRADLARRLPVYMTPTAFVALDAMPLSPNGKVDREALPAPGAQFRGSADQADAPSTPTEKTVAELYSQILSVEEVGLNDDFFSLGGHSLLATRLISRIGEAFQTRFPAADFFADPTVSGIASRLEAARVAREE